MTFPDQSSRNEVKPGSVDRRKQRSLAQKSTLPYVASSQAKELEKLIAEIIFRRKVQERFRTGSMKTMCSLKLTEEVDDF